MRNVYVAGPMTGIPWFNFPEFIRAGALLEERGWRVFNPALVDLGSWHNLPDAAPSIQEFAVGRMPFLENEYEAIIQRDLDMIQALHPSNGDAMALLDGWKESKGALAEAALAEWKGLMRLPYKEILNVQL